MCCISQGEEWRKIRSNATKQVIPRRVANFVEPLSVIAEELLSHLEALQDEGGNVQDVSPELSKWAFQGRYCETKPAYVLTSYLDCMDLCSPFDMMHAHTKVKY